MTKTYSPNQKKFKATPGQLDLFTPLSLTVMLTSLAIAPFTFDAFVIPKIFVLYSGLLAIAIFGFVKRDRLLGLTPTPKWFLGILISIQLLIVISTINSKTPLLRSLFGQFGRGNGLFYYFAAFSVLLIATISFTNTYEAKFSKLMTYVSLGLGIYTLLQSLGIDFAKLKNVDLLPTVLTYGNSNFAGGMLAVLFGFVFTRAFSEQKLRTIDILISLLLIFSIYKTGAVQGYLIVMFVIAVVIPVRLVRDKAISWKVFLYSFWFTGIILIGLGATGFGPFARVFERASFQMRIEYWVVGFRILKENLLLGVGPDRLYDITPHYMTPGSLQIITTTRMDSPHNWFINVATSFGLFTGILFVMLLTLISILYLRSVKLDTFLNNTSAATFIAFLCLILDGLVSIEQPGLGIWLYFLGGKVLASALQSRLDSIVGEKRRVNIQSFLAWRKTINVVGMGLILLLFFSLTIISQRFVGDGLLRSAIQKSAFQVSTQEDLGRIESLTIKLKAEPEYVVQSVPVLAKYGAGPSLLKISETFYNYNPASIQALGIRAQVLKVVTSPKSSCNLQSKLLSNTPWEKEVVSDFLLCYTGGYKSEKSRSQFIQIEKYINFSFPLSTGGVTQDSILALAVRARVEHELNSTGLATSLKKDAQHQLLDFKTINPQYDSSRIEDLLNF